MNDVVGVSVLIVIPLSFKEEVREVEDSSSSPEAFSGEKGVDYMPLEKEISAN